MNILFYTYYRSALDAAGGTEIATARVAHALQQQGINTINCYFEDKTPGASQSPFTASFRLSQRDTAKQLANIINSNDIHAIFNEGDFFFHTTVTRAIKLSGRNIRHFFSLHFLPGSEMLRSTFAALKQTAKTSRLNWTNTLRMALHPLFYARKQWRLRQRYRAVYNDCEKVVLLSQSHVPLYQQFARIEDQDRFIVIPNIIEPPQHATAKQHRVLVLSRMEEQYKRISMVFPIWQQAMSNTQSTNWQLDIVGDGPDLEQYKRICSEMALNNVTFHGWQNPQPFLQQSHILIVTSRSEAFGMTIAEAQANGCVPIAFNSFPTAAELITDGNNGYLIPTFGDTATFAGRLARLMDNDERRCRMSAQAQETSKKFSPAQVSQHWLNLLST